MLKILDMSDSAWEADETGDTCRVANDPAATDRMLTDPAQQKAYMDRMQLGLRLQEVSFAPHRVATEETERPLLH